MYVIAYVFIALYIDLMCLHIIYICNNRSEPNPVHFNSSCGTNRNEMSLVNKTEDIYDRGTTEVGQVYKASKAVSTARDILSTSHSGLLPVAMVAWRDVTQCLLVL